MCSPGSKTCLDPGHAQTCDDQGNGYVTTTCPPSAPCSGGVCACQAGAVWCQGDQIFTCGADLEPDPGAGHRKRKGRPGRHATRRGAHQAPSSHCKLLKARSCPPIAGAGCTSARTRACRAGERLCRGGVCLLEPEPELGGVAPRPAPRSPSTTTSASGHMVDMWRLPSRPRAPAPRTWRTTSR
jgi:hypothetical protein